MTSSNVNARVGRHRDRLRQAGLRPVQIWVADTRRADFAAECHQQSLLVAQADAGDAGLDVFLEQTLEDIEGWTA